MKTLLFTAVLLFYADAAAAQADSLSRLKPGETVTVIPDSSLAAGSTHRYFFGEQWRNVWTTPVKVEVLDLQKFGGGLTPTEIGGGTQTVSLRFKGKDGLEYKFRSVNKDLSALLPEDLRKTVVSDILQEQVSTANPYGSLMAVPLMDALNIMNAPPELFIMPDDPKLGEFREQFAGMLGTIEVHPDDGKDGKKGFEGSEKISGTLKLFDRMEEDNDDYFDAAGFLKVRLLDFIIGDWDRHYDQWRWARYKENGKNIWKPIPRDRDQAFAKFDGIFPSLVQKLVPNFTSFSDEFASIGKAAYSGRYLDRRILIGMNKQSWDSVALYVKNNLTDESIQKAVKVLPEELYNKYGKGIADNLISRRNNIKEMADDYYFYIFEYAEVYASDKDETIEVNRLDDDRVEVKIIKKKGDTYFHQVFNTGVTDEIRIFAQKGEDVIKVTGTVEESVPVIITAEDGNDTLIDSSKVKGDLFSFIPFIEDSEDLTEFYTDGKDNKIIKGSGTEVYKYKEREYTTEEEKYETPRDHGLSVGATGWFNINSYDGLFLGGGPVFTKYGYMADPAVYQMIFRGGYATAPSKFRFTFEGNFYRIIRGINLQLNMRLSGLDVINFYGYGNQTTESKALRDADFYQVQQEQYMFSPQVIIPLIDNLNLFGGASVEFNDMNLKDNTLINQLRPYGSGDKLLYKLLGGIYMDNRNHKAAPDSGYYFYLGGEYAPGYKNYVQKFSRLKSEIKYYIPLPLKERSVIALRAGGVKLWGNYPFYESAFIGGDESLRGYERERFAGSASLYFNSEVRFNAARIKILIPFLFGISFTAETGRVFYPGDYSKKWHSSYGGGIWTSVINRDLTFSLNFARSVEDIQYYFNIGFAY